MQLIILLLTSSIKFSIGSRHSASLVQRICSMQHQLRPQQKSCKKLRQNILIYFVLPYDFSSVTSGLCSILILSKSETIPSWEIVRYTIIHAKRSQVSKMNTAKTINHSTDFNISVADTRDASALDHRSQIP